ncbi:MAG: hypothetical protein Q9167_003921 [Letrouitia subvulpina]
MGPPVATAKLTLSYPLFASDFDPQNNSFLLVGGGGGEGRTGVGNKITLVNASRKQAVSEVVEIHLSQDEDSVTSLAVASSTESSVTAFAGINSSRRDQNAGKNEHLRSFRLEYPPRRVAQETSSEDIEVSEYKGQTTALGRASLFTPSTVASKETYQRITRLSKPQKATSGQLGAIATGLAPDGEVVLFDAKTNGPKGPWIRARLSLGKGQEAADVDILSLEEEKGSAGAFVVAYCTEYKIYVCKFSLKQQSPIRPQVSYEEPHPEVSSSKSRPKLRSVRFITSSLLVLLQNRPDRQGADIRFLELSPSLQGKILCSKTLHRGIKSATALSVCHLPAPSPSEGSQHALAVAGHDMSISVFTLEHPAQPPFGSLKAQLHVLLKSVHPSTITSLAFSTFVHPSTPQASTPPQYLKLASTSVANTVIVHTMPLMPYPAPSKKSPKTRYVLKSPGPSEAMQTTFSVLMSALVIGLGALFLQAYLEIRGGSPAYLGANDWLSRRVQDYVAVPYMFKKQANDVVSVVSPTGSISQVTDTTTNGHEQGENIASESILSSLNALASEALSSVSSASSAMISSSTPKANNLHIRGLLSRHHHHRHPATDSPAPHMVIHAEEGGNIKAGFLNPKDAAVEGGNKGKTQKWEDLSHKEREMWKKRLQEAGAWAVDEGEAVLKGVFFGQMAGFVGEAVRGAMA